MKRVHILVYGNVHGVFFRHNTSKIANSLGLTGFVRNLDDGSVEVVAEGSEDKLRELVDFCRKGPIGAKVDSIKVEFGKVTNEFSGFGIRH